MWFSRGGAAARATAAVSSSIFVRYFARERAVNVRKINPKVSPQEAYSIARDLYGVFRTHGPLSVGNTWVHAQEAGVSGLQSKTHMKILLKWMRGRKMLKLLCTQVGSNKKFLHSALSDEPQKDPPVSTSGLNLQTEKPPMKKFKGQGKGKGKGKKKSK